MPARFVVFTRVTLHEPTTLSPFYTRTITGKNKLLNSQVSSFCKTYTRHLFPYTILTILEVGGADGLVKLTISCMASLSFNLCNGLLIPISLWISVSDSADMMAPLLTFARQAATYHAGIPTHSSNQATTVGPFHSANGVPAFMASASSSCLLVEGEGK